MRNMKRLTAAILGLLVSVTTLLTGFSLPTKSSLLSNETPHRKFKIIDGDLLVNSEVDPNMQMAQNQRSTQVTIKSTKKDHLTTTQLFKKHNLKKISPQKFPTGSTVLKFDSVDNADKFLSQFKKDTSQTMMLNAEPVTTVPYSTLGGTLQRRSVWRGPSKVNLWADISWNSSKIITSCNAWTSRTGIVVSSSWDQKYAYCSPSKGTRTTMVKGGGVITIDIIIRGIGSFYSEDLNIHYGYTVP